MLIFKMLPRLHVFRFNVAIYLAAYLHRAVLIIHPNHYAAEFPPLWQALLKKGKPTCLDFLVSEYYRVGGQELAYQLSVLL